MLFQKDVQSSDKISCVITEIDKDKEELQYLKATTDNPFKVLIENPVGSIIEGTISSSNDYAIYVKLKDMT